MEGDSSLASSSARSLAVLKSLVKALRGVYCALYEQTSLCRGAVRTVGLQELSIWGLPLDPLLHFGTKVFGHVSISVDDQQKF